MVAKTTITTKELRWFCKLEMCWNTTRVMIQVQFLMFCLTVLGNILRVIMDPKCRWPSPGLPTITLYLSGFKTKLCTLVIQILRTADILFFKFRWMKIFLYQISNINFSTNTNFNVGYFQDKMSDVVPYTT